MEQLNQCGLFLGAQTLSDIVTGCGQMISESAWKGWCNPEWVTQSEFPNQGHPGQNNWTVWHDALTQCFCNKKQHLLNSLGYWKSKAQPSRWYYEPTEDQLYHDGNQLYYLPWQPGWATTQAAYSMFLAPSQMACNIIPAMAQKATVYWVGQWVQLTGYAPTEGYEVASELTSLAEFIAT